MSRWKPDGAERLEMAALELFADQGFDVTTVAQIAARAGLTERTFYRHFGDKREVLFPTNGALSDLLTEGVRQARLDSTALEAVRDAFSRASALFDERADLARRRHTVVAASPELREREAFKLFALVEELDGALRERGVDAVEAGMAAELGVAAFKVAFTGWMGDSSDGSLGAHLESAFALMSALTLSRDPKSAAGSTSTVD